MALIQVNFTSSSLMRMVPIQVILPVEKETARETFPTLYLLHGVTGNYTDWVSRTNIQRWAEAKGLAVVMPSGDNGFYIDRPESHNYYGEFVGRELVEITRKMFPLSHRREDTFLAGLSMGGYGAIRNGLKYHDIYGCIAGLSTANIVEGIEERTNDTSYFLSRRDFAESIFGDLSKVKNSDKNPQWLAEQLAAAGAALPRIYLACGTDDALLEDSRNLRDCLRAAGADVTYEEGPGGHEWDFWDRYIRRVIDWLPLCQDTGSGGKEGSNSPLVVYTRLSPNHSGKRTMAIDRISPHCAAGQMTVERLGEIFAPVERQASSNYGIGLDGKVGMYVEECNRSWCTSSSANDQRAVTIECASDPAEPYAFTSVVYSRLIDLCEDICRRNGKTKLLWLEEKERTLAYKPAADEMVLTVHRWFSSKSCPGDWMFARMGDLAQAVTARLADKRQG